MKYKSLYRNSVREIFKISSILLVAALAHCPLGAMEVVLHSGDRFQSTQPLFENETFKDIEQGIAVQAKYISELRWDHTPVAPLDPSSSQPPSAGPVHNRVTVFPLDLAPLEGILSRITSTNIELVQGDQSVVNIPVDGTHLLRFPAPRPWAQASELAELHDPLLEKDFASLLDTPVTTQPLYLLRVLEASADGLKTDMRRTIERFADRPNPVAVQSFNAPPKTRLVIHHITAVDGEGALYHFLDGQFRQEQDDSGVQHMNWIAPHPAAPHLLSTEIELIYSQYQAAGLEHLFQKDISVTQKVELRYPSDLRLHWAFPPGTPISYSEPEPGVIVWEYLPPSQTEDTDRPSPTLRIDWSESKLGS